MTPGDSIAHYRITSKLGEGGMGEVWRASDTKLNRDVAIKVLPEAVATNADRMARFQREAQVLASLNHPNIAAIYGVEDGALVMELVEGPTLAERIAQAPVPLEEALGLARQIGDALEAAHEKGVIHRDLKPANIKLTADGRVKVLDFGLAKAMAGDASSGDAANSPTLTMRATVAGVILGTAGYMAPEQAKGKAVDKRADIWAFGVVLYEMLTGEALFGGETVSDTLAAVLTRDPDLERVPAPVRKLLRSCLEKDPKRRLRDIGDAWRLVEEAPVAPAVTAERARPVAWMVAAGLALIAVALAFVHFREAPAQAPLVRFSVPPPEKGSFGEWLALSPDGRHLAFTGAGSDGVWRVWVRSFDALEPRPLAASEESSTITVFWSPDSRFLVFQSGGKLKKIDLAGGPPQTLCDAPTVMLGGSWNADGVILFGSNSGPIMRVSSAGGTASPVTRLEQSRNEGLHTDPVFLPDGIHFLYFRHSGKPEDEGVFAGSLQAGPGEQSLKRVAATDYSPAYAPPRGGGPGYLLFLREGSLLAQQFDTGRLETVSETVPVADQIGVSISRAFFSVSGNGVLAYRTGSASVMQLKWYDREGHVLGNAAEGADYQDVSISPDGSRLAYDRSTQGPLRQIWILDIRRGIHSRFTFVPDGAHSPVWSPDGLRMAFAAESRNAIYFQNVVNGGDPKRVSEPGMLNLSGWSPDGRFLLYTQARHGYDIMALPDSAGGGERKPLAIADSEANEMHGQVSPDSRWVAYDSNETGRSEIYIRPFPPGGDRSGKWQISANGGQQPRWRGDGKELFYIAPDGGLMAVDVKTQPALQPATPHTLFTTPSITGNSLAFQYDVTRDGKRFIVVAPSVSAVPAPATVVQNWQTELKK